ncbi:MAG: hypothetical protein AB1486_02615 [Planctomycetota bacterium]
MARRAGATEAEIAALDDPSAHIFPPAEQAAFALAEALTRDPRGDHDETYAMLASHFDEGQIVEILTTVALFNFFNRLANGLGLEG